MYCRAITKLPVRYARETDLQRPDLLDCRADWAAAESNNFGRGDKFLIIQKTKKAEAPVRNVSVDYRQFQSML